MPSKTKSTKNSTNCNLNILSESQIRHALNSLFFEVNGQFLKTPNEISEYDIQSQFSNQLRYQFKNRGIALKREKEKYDISIQKKKNTKLSQSYRIEIKTFIKKHESLSTNKIHEDFKKLRTFLSKLNGIKTKAFFLIAVTQKKLKAARGCNKLFSEFCLYNHNKRELERLIDSKFKVYRSYFIGAGNNGNHEPIANQIRFILFELK